MKSTQIITKWYNALEFPKEYDKEFFELLNNTKLPENMKISEYSVSKDKADAGKNLLMCLYFCHELESKYKELGIPDKILMDTLWDVVYWAGIHYGLMGKIGLSEFDWLNNHINMKLFRIGRLQYCFDRCWLDIESIGVKNGDMVLFIHIPAGEKLDNDECKQSIEQAREFFAEYFPNEPYKCFTCSSWLLDETLKEFLKDTSNILKFQEMFKIVGKKESCSALKYTVRWDATKENLQEYADVSPFGQKLINHVSNGGKLYSGFGYIPK